MIIGLTVARPIVVGIVQGAGFGLVAIGIVLIYKSARVFNFAAGEFATLGAFGAYLAQGSLGSIPWIGGPLMALCGVAAGVAIGLLTERLVVRPLSDRPKVTVLVATAAVAISLIALQFLSPKVQGRLFREKPVWRGDMTWFGRQHLYGVIVSHQQVLIVVTLAITGGLLAWFFAKTDMGLATLASSQEPTATRLMGVRLSRVSLLVWGMAGGLAGLAGVLLTAVNGSFNPAFGTTDLLIPAFTAAVLGGMTSVPGAFAGGILLGIVENMAQFNVTSKTLPGAPDVAVLVVLIGVLLVRPAGLMGKEA